MKFTYVTLFGICIASVAASPAGCRPHYPPPQSQVTEYPTSPNTDEPSVPTTAPETTDEPPPPTSTTSKLTSAGAVRFYATAYAVAFKDGDTNTDGEQGEALGPVNACGQALWIGGGPCTYCPTVVGNACPKSDVTAFSASGNAMDVMVPGGQQTYLSPQQYPAFTQAHSMFIPQGSTIGYFKSLAVAGEEDGYFLFSDAYWIACPPNPTQFPGSASFKIFAKTDKITDEFVGGKLEDCKTVHLRTKPFVSDSLSAWQYT